jgi:hypothetical protein
MSSLAHGQLCSNCIRILPLQEHKGGALQHHSTAQQLLESADQCVLCEKLYDTWCLDYAHDLYPDLTEEDYPQIKLKLSLRDILVQPAGLCFGLLDVKMSLTRYAYEFADTYSLTTCEAESSSQLPPSRGTMTTI